MSSIKFSLEKFKVLYLKHFCLDSDGDRGNYLRGNIKLPWKFFIDTKSTSRSFILLIDMSDGLFHRLSRYLLKLFLSSSSSLSFESSKKRKFHQQGANVFTYNIQ